MLKRVPSIYALFGALIVAFSLSACNTAQLPEVANTTLSTQSAAPEMRVRSVSLDTETRNWLAALKNTPNYASTTGTYSLERLAGGGRVQDLSRHLNLQLTGVLSALRVTGDRALLEKVYLVMQRERGTLLDTNGDGYLNWRYLPAGGQNPDLYGTDLHVMEEIMAHSIVAQAAYAFKLNADVDSKYGAAASFWTDYLVNHYEAKWRKRTGRKAGYPIIEKPLFHPYANNTRYYHYLYKLTGNSAYKNERDRQVGVIKRQLLPDNGAYVWTHLVNEYLHSRNRKMGWSYQPVGYAGEAMAPLADLGLEGVLDESTMRGLAKTLSVKLLDEKDRSQVLAGDVGGSRAASYFIPFLNTRMTLKSSGYPRGYIGTYVSRGYALLAPWDGTGEVAADSASYYRASGGWPIAPAGVLLARRYQP